MERDFWEFQNDLICISRPYHPLQLGQTEAVSHLVAGLIKLPDGLLRLYVVQPEVSDYENPTLLRLPFINLHQF